MARPLRRFAVLVAAAFTLAAVTLAAVTLAACAAPGGGSAGRPDTTGGPGASASAPAGGSGSPAPTNGPPITVPPGPTGPPTPPSTNRPPAGTPTLVTGVVDAEPGCPGPVTDPPCPARPVAGALVEVTGPGGAVASTVTDKDGRFTLRLAPGTYRFTATNTGGLRSRVTKLVRVPISAPVELTVDSGMR